MNTQTFQEVISDQSYNEGFDRASKIAERKYNKLLEASKTWFQIYESSFGCPDETGNDEYWTLRKLLKLPN